MDSRDPFMSNSVRQRCPVCSGPPRPLHGSGCADAWICGECAHTYVRTLPTAAEAADVYALYGYDRLDDEPLPQFLDSILDALIASFERHRDNGRLLDVGFGAGGLLTVAQRRGWSTFGIELSRAAVERGRAIGLGEVVQGNFLEAPFPDGHFDVIVMTELVEHLFEPLPFLQKAAALLRPGGLLYMTTPHGRGLSGRVLGASWSVLRPPEHLQLFSLDSMRRSLATAGFRHADVYTQGLLPHELIAKLRARLPKPSPSRRSGTAPVSHAFEGRVTRGYALNAALMQNRVGRALKASANRALRASRLGDSLRVEAVR